MKSAKTDPVDVNLTWVGLIVEGGLVAAALLLALLGLYDHRQPLADLNGDQIQTAVFWGMIATVPMLIYLAVFHFYPLRFLQPMRDFVLNKLHPIFRGSTWLEMLFLSLMAGFGEELFFRWCLQGGLTSLLEPVLGYPAAMAVGLVWASVLFGLCHWVNASYGLTTITVGLYLGWIMIWSETFLVPAIAHAAYDFVAMIYVARLRP